MKTIRDLELELTIDWKSLQKLESEMAKSIAIKAYYIKYRMYRKARGWHYALSDKIDVPVLA